MKLIRSFGLERAAARNSPADLACYCSKGRADEWTLFPHLEVVDDALREVERGKLKRLMVFMPPRHGKSELISKWFPAWFLGRHPKLKIIHTSYEAHFSQDWGAKARDILIEHGNTVFGKTVKKDKRAVANWQTVEGGGMTCTGAGGPITGKGADLFIIDDPIKNDEEAFSARMREKQWDWWRSTARSRLQKNGSVVLIQTRWHEDDLAGRMIRESTEDWRVINFPALAEENDILGREVGETLCPELISQKEMETNKLEAGEYFWNALYQQRPSPLSGGIFKRSWVKTYEKEGDLYGLEASGFVSEQDCYIVSTVDLAASVKESADYTVISTWAVTLKRDLILLDCIRERLEGPDQLHMIRNVARRMRPAWIGIEKAGYQMTAIQTLLREGFPIRELIPDRDKVARAIPAAARMEAGLVFFPKVAHYLDTIIHELMVFPNGKHDDFVDTFGYAARDLFENVMPAAY